MEPDMDNTPQPAGDDSPSTSRRQERRRRWRRRRMRVLQATAVLPSMATIFNGLSGFGAIHFVTKDGLGRVTVGNLAIAAGLIFLAMFWDMLDGRLARMTRRTSDFGGQLDSMCDVISFGVAPAVILLQAVVGALHHINMVNVPLERTVWCVAGVYVACAALRLARFNVENVPDESAHMTFRGLPSPGAAATVAGLVLLYTRLIDMQRDTMLEHLIVNALPQAWIYAAAAIVLPLFTLVVALLMVSRVRYPHLVNQYIRGKRSFGYLVKLLIVVVVAALEPFVFLAVGTVGFALSGPVSAFLRQRRLSRGPSNAA